MASDLPLINFRLAPELVEKVDRIASTFERDRSYTVRKFLQYCVDLNLEKIEGIMNPPIKNTNI